jgi:catechol 2,3-dioxygenase-like lactoylglutathione lyase family enzyme
MLASYPVIAFAATTDAARARAFYEDTLGLRFVADEPHALVFDLAGITLRIQKLRELAVSPFTVLGWRVPDIAPVMRDLAARGVAFERFPFLEQDEAGAWTAPSGAKIAWFKDPDGNTLSLTQL